MTGTNSFPAHIPDAPLANPLPVDDNGTQAALSVVTTAVNAVTSTLDNGINVTIDAPVPLPVLPDSRPKVHAGVFYFVDSASSHESLLAGVGITHVIDSFDEAFLLGINGGSSVESLTITAFNADPNIDGSTGKFVSVQMNGGMRVFIPAGMTMSWSVLETWGTGPLVDLTRIDVKGEAYAIVNYTVRD